MTAHHVIERHSPTHVQLSCVCGWTAEITRKQNARARAAKVKAKKREHLEQAERCNDNH